MIKFLSMRSKYHNQLQERTFKWSDGRRRFHHRRNREAVKNYYGANAKLVEHGSYIYQVNEEIYNEAI